MIIDSFAEMLENMGVATRGQDLFIGNAPSSNKVPDSIWWLVQSGGDKEINLSSGEALKNYRVEVYCRNRNEKVVRDALFQLEEDLNCDGCTQLDGYETVDVEAITFPVSQDIDDEDRSIGLLQVNLKIYKEC